MHASSQDKHSLYLIGMPAWDVTKPFHALALVAQVAREAGFRVEVSDLNIDFYHLCSEEEKRYWTEDLNHLWFVESLPRQLWEKYETWFKTSLDSFLSSSAPSLIAFSVNMSTRFFSIYAARYIKKHHPGIPVMFGGVDCFKGEQNTSFLGRGWNRFCDIICQGECELSFRDYLLRFIRENTWKTTVPGFAYYDGWNLVDTGEGELPSLNEVLPIPAYDLFDLSKYTEKGSLPFYSSRGCIYSCEFCSEKANFKRYRCRKADEAFRELLAVLPFARQYAERPTLTFADSIFNANMKELERFAELIIENNISVQWGAQGHIHHRMTGDVLRKLAHAGLISVFWGIESGSQHTIDLMNKRYSISDARRVIDDCITLGIEQHIPILIGFPGERPEDVVDTLELIFRYKDQPHCHVHLPCQIVVRPNSPLYEHYAAFGLASPDYYEWHTSDQANTLPIRIARRFVARQVHSNPALCFTDLVDTEEIGNVSINDHHTANDLYHLLHEVARRGKALEDFYAWISSRCAEISKPTSPTPEATPENEMALHLWLWTKVDKDGSYGRESLYRIILALLARLKNHGGSDDWGGVSQQEAGGVLRENP